MITVLTAWTKLEFTMISAIHESVHHLRQVLTEAALGIAAMAPIPQGVLAARGGFEHTRWTEVFGRLQAEAQARRL